MKQLLTIFDIMHVLSDFTFSDRLLRRNDKGGEKNDYIFQIYSTQQAGGKNIYNLNDIIRR